MSRETLTAKEILDVVKKTQDNSDADSFYKQCELSTLFDLFSGNDAIGSWISLSSEMQKSLRNLLFNKDEQELVTIGLMLQKIDSLDKDLQMTLIAELQLMTS